MSETKRILFLIVILVVITAITTIVAISLLYHAALEEDRTQLTGTVKSHARLIEAIIDHEAKFSHFIHDSLEHGTVSESVLYQLQLAYSGFKWFGKTGEFTLAKQSGDSVVFLLRHRKTGNDGFVRISIFSGLAEPMIRALNGESGTIIGLDYRGKTVLAAFEPVKKLGYGIVAKIDLEEVRDPFLKASFICGIIALIMIVGGSFFFVKITAPIMKNMKISEEKFRSIFQQAAVGICHISLDGNFIISNAKFSDIVGYSIEELVNDINFRVLIHPDDDKSINAEIGSDLLSGKARSRSIEQRLIQKDGNVIWVRMAISLSKTRFDASEYYLTVVEDISDQKKVEIELSESTRRLETLVSNLPGMVYRCINESKWPMVYISGGCHELLDCSDEEVNGGILNYGELVHPEDRKYVWNTVQNAIENDKPFALEYRIFTKRGKEKWVWERGRKIATGESGEAVIEGFITDITQRKLVHQALLESEERYRIIFDTARDALFLNVMTAQNRIGNIVETNAMATQLLGYSRDEFTGMSIIDLVSGEERESTQEFYERFSEKGFSLNNMNLQSKSGKSISLEISAHRFEFKNKQMLLFIARDIRERNKFEIELSKSEEKFKHLTDLLPQIVFEVDTEGKMTYTNLYAVEATGYSAEDLSSGMSFFNFIHPQDRERIGQRMALLLSGEQLRGDEYLILRKDKTTFPALIYSRTIISDGEVTGVRGIVADITERKHLEDQLFQSHKMEGIGKLAGGVAHDFNNILTVITGNTELALAMLDSRDPLRDDLYEVYEASLRATELTRQLLAFSRRQTLQPKIVDLNTLVANLSKMLLRIIGEDVEFITEFEHNLWKVRIDPGQMEQVLINLTVNARDAMPSGGKLIIETRNIVLDEEYASSQPNLTPGQYAMLVITDTGTGIPEEKIAQIYEPFFTTKEVGKGTGLGLSMVYGIITQSEGHINVYSEEGLGTTFKIYLPRIEAEADEEDNNKITIEMPRGNEVVMVVEDEKPVLNFTSKILKQQGYKVIEANNGGEAWLIGKDMEKQPDLLLTDVKMPKMGGKTLAEHLREIWPDLKVIYMSGYTASGITETGILEKDTPYIQKPFRPIDLAWKVRRVLDI